MMNNNENAEDRKKNTLLYNQLKSIEKQEFQLLHQKENTFIKSKLAPVIDKIQEKIPEKLKTVLDMAFYKSFQLVFEKGNTYIEKTYNKDKIQLEHDLNNYAVDKYSSRKHIKNMDRQSTISASVNTSLAVLEGGILGAFGIGLPDIPLFISVIIRTVNEISLSYGHLYDTQEEKAYLLYIICGAITTGEKQKEFNDKIDTIGARVDADIVMDINLDDYMKETSNVLSEALLTAKFIQGIPVVGAVGGVVNHAIINKIAKYAKIKYKKRYLIRKMDETK